MNNRISKFELIIELMKTSYPIVCFGLAGTISVSAIASNNLSTERWTGVLGLAGGAITAGAGIAQAPQPRRGCINKKEETESVP